MKLKPLTLLFVILFFQGQAQNSSEASHLFTQYEKDFSWVTINPEYTISADRFFEENYQLLGLQSPRDMQILRDKKDQFGWRHVRCQQYYKDVPVTGGVYILHEKEGRVIKANGKIFSNIELSTQASITAQEAIQYALQHHPSDAYLWNNESAEQILKRSKKDERATYYPQPKLVVLDKTLPIESGEMVLAYQMEIQIQNPVARYIVYVDAQNGQIVQSYNNLHPTTEKSPDELPGYQHNENNSHHCNGHHTHQQTIAEGTAETRYHGTQTIWTDMDNSGKYILQDETRGVLIETLDAWNDDNIVTFKDDDNYWDNVNDRQDEVATDAHFGATETFDYFLEKFGRNSYDDNGATLTSLVHWDDNWNNASWNGSVMSYGDGDGILFNPLTAIDVCGHELTHAVTGASAELIYQFESGALNESFSDIFGKAIEHYAVPDQFTWSIGEFVKGLAGRPIRSMEDPNIFGDPKYYLGENWHTDDSDNGGVHTNSGVQNYWYYLLVEGGQVTNELGEVFDIAPIGFDKADQIAYRNLTVYLTPSSDHEDARKGAMEAAADLYGFCSEEHITVSKAWAAVGVGYEIRDGDYVLEPEEDFIPACELTQMEVKFNLFNNGCNETLAPGTSFPVSYQMDGNPMVTETVTLSELLDAGQTFAYTFSQVADVVGYGEHRLKIWATPPNDVLTVNNFVEIIFINRPAQNDDFSLVSLRDPGGVCSISDFKPISASGAYLGCDSLAPTELPFKYFYKGTTFEDLELTFIKMAPFDEVNLFGAIIFPEYGFDNGTFTLEYPGDSNPDNNSGTFYLARLDHLENNWIEDFSAGTSLDSVHLGIYKEERANSAIQTFDDYSYIMTGSDVFNDLGAFLVQPRSNPVSFMFANAEYVTTMDICLDVRNMQNPQLYFDLAQTRSNFDYAAYGVDPEFSTMLGVFIDNVLVGSMIYGGPNNGEFVSYQFDLNDYKDLTHHLQIRALALQGSISSNGTIEVDGDNNIIDFIEIRDDLDVSVNDPLQADLLKITPNPSADAFIISRKDGRTFEKARIEVYDAAGKLHFSETLKGYDNDFTFGEHLVPGIYFVKVVDGANTGFSKIVKQ